MSSVHNSSAISGCSRTYSFCYDKQPLNAMNAIAVVVVIVAVIAAVAAVIVVVVVIIIATAGVGLVVR